MKVLVTGGAGFIGSHIVEHFNGKAEIRVLDNFRTGHKSNLSNFDVELLEGSIEDTAIVKQAMEGVDYVFHLAAPMNMSFILSRIYTSRLNLLYIIACKFIFLFRTKRE